MRSSLLTTLLAAVPAAATLGAHPIMTSHHTPGPGTVNGSARSHEQYGPAAGTPLVLLPGGGSTIQATFGRFLPLISRHRRGARGGAEGDGTAKHHPRPQRA